MFELNQIKNSILGEVQKIGQGFSNQAQQAGQQLKNVNFNPMAPRTAPGLGSTTPNFQPIQNTFHALPLPVQNFSHQLVNTVANQPLIQLPGIGIKPQLPFSPTVGQYVQGQFINPAKQLLNPKNTPLDKLFGGVQLGFNATPAGNAYNLSTGIIAGGIRSARTGKNFNDSVKQAISNPSDIGGTGLGMSGIPALAVDLLTGNPKGTLESITSLKRAAQSFLKNKGSHLPAYTVDAIEHVMEPQNRESIINTLINFDKTYGSDMPKTGIPNVSLSNEVRQNLEMHYKQIYGATAKIPQDIYQLKNGVAYGLLELTKLGNAGESFSKNARVLNPNTREVPQAGQSIKMSLTGQAPSANFSDGLPAQGKQPLLNQEIKPYSDITGNDSVISNSIPTQQSEVLSKQVNPEAQTSVLSTVQAKGQSPRNVNLPTYTDIVAQGKTKSPTITQANQQINEWEKQIKGETITQKQFNASKTKTFTQEDKALQAADGGTKAYKNGKLSEINSGFPSKALESTAVKDKAPFLYQRETLLRNIEDTFKNPQDRQAVKSYLHDPIIQNETANVTFQNNLRQSLTDNFNKLGIKRGSKQDLAAADFIEGKLTLGDLQKQFPTQWKNITQAAEQGRSVYKNLLSQINSALSKYGYSPIPERQNYVTHTQQIQTLVERFGNLLNFTKEKLPTEMSAINVDTKPGKEFFKFALKRQGGSTHEGLITALDKYITPAGNQIYHTGDIQRTRALQQFLQKSASPQETTLSNFNSYIGQYANFLAGKKSIIDRPVEKIFGRGVLTLGNELKKRTGANMVGGNLASAITNFIPFTQSVATTSKPSVVKGLYEASLGAGKNASTIDGVQSGFLTRRFPVDQIGSNAESKIKGGMNFLFNTIDKFTSRAIVAGKYFEGLSKGLDKVRSMAQADEYAARTLADRSYGQVPLLFNSKVLGAFTQFQVEVNNQMSFFLKDIPKNLGYNKAQVASALTQAVLYSYIFNNLFQKVTGRRPQIDPLHAALSLYSNIQQGNNPKDYLNPTNQNSPVGEIVQNLPFTSTLTGGRLPLSSALPDVPGLLSGQTTLPKEVSKSIAFLGSPIGGGGQIQKTIAGLSAYNQGASTTSKGNVRFPIAKNTLNLIRTSLFGQYSTPEANQYFQNNGNPLSANQSAIFNASNDPQSYYNDIMKVRGQNQEIKKLSASEKGTSSDSRVNDEVAKNNVKANGGYATLSDGSIAYQTPKGTVVTLDLTPPTKGTGIGSFANTGWKATKAASIWNNPDIPQDLKTKVLQKLNINPEDARYAGLASYSSDISAQYITSKSPDHQTLLHNIISGRVVGITGTQFADNSVITKLVDDGQLSKEEGAYLKKIKIVKENGKLVQKMTGRVGKKVSLSGLKKTITPVKLKSYTGTPTIKLKGVPKISIPNVSLASGLSPTGAMPQIPNFKTKIKFNL